MVEFYPMPLFVKLSVNDMENTLHWYKEILDFDFLFNLPGEDGETVMAHIRGEKYQDLMLVTDQSEKETNGKGVVLNFTVKDIDSVLDKAHKFNAEIVEGPIDRLWNARELVLKDPNGYLITLSMGLDKDKNFDDVMGEVKHSDNQKQN